MFKKIISIVPVAALSLTVSANASTITVQEGDTLWDLAQANHTSVENIQLVNHLTTDLIHPGDVLTVAQQKQYTVQSGDTLWDIAKNYDVSISQIQEWNQLETDLIHPDLNLVIFDGVKNSNIAVSDKSTIYSEKEQKEYTAETTIQSNYTKAVNTPEVTAPSANSTGSKAVKTDSDASSNTSSNEDTPETPTKEATNVAPKENEEPTPQEETKAVKEITVEASAYTASCEGCTGVTATGIDLKANPNAKVISVDPTVIPLGSNVYVEGYGEAIAGDTGGNIKGNRIDVFLPSEQDAANFGVKQLKVKILN